MNTDDLINLRITALTKAITVGCPPDKVVTTAREYYKFLVEEPKPEGDKPNEA